MTIQTSNTNEFNATFAMMDPFCQNEKKAVFSDDDINELTNNLATRDDISMLCW